MHSLSRIYASRLLAAGLCAFLAIPSIAQVAVRSVKVLGSRDAVEIEVEASDRIVPQSQVLTGPDRLVVDFPNALPSNQVRSQSIDRGEVKDVRVGLFQAKPPVTRLVVDLKSARSYKIFPYGRTVMIKVMGTGNSNALAPGGEGQPHLVAANYVSGAEPVRVESQPSVPLQVAFRNGLLSIHANKATLSQVLYAVQQRTGADISIAAGAEQETVVAEIDPAPAPEVLARLLNGSRFNFLILSSANDPQQLDKVILTTRMDGANYMPPPVQASAEDTSAPEPAVARNETGNPPGPQMPGPLPPQAEIKDEGPEQ